MGIFGALTSKAGGEVAPNTQGATTTPQFDPLLSAISADALGGLGFFDPGVLQQSSPINQAIALLNRTAATDKEKRRIGEALSRGFAQFGTGGSVASGEGDLNSLDMRWLVRFASLTGHRNIEDLFAQESQFAERIAPLQARLQESAGGQFDARLGARTDLASLIGNLPDASASAIEALRGTEQESILRDLNRNVDEQSQDFLRSSNFAGINPGRGLGDLEEFRARRTADSSSEALSRALALIGGQQQVAGQGASLLDSFLTGTQNQALAAANARNPAPGGTSLSNVQFDPNPGKLSSILGAGENVGLAALQIAALSGGGGGGGGFDFNQFFGGGGPAAPS